MRFEHIVKIEAWKFQNDALFSFKWKLINSNRNKNMQKKIVFDSLFNYLLFWSQFIMKTLNLFEYY